MLLRDEYQEDWKTVEELSIKALTLWKMTRGTLLYRFPDNVWNNQNQKHAEFKDAEALFKRSEFTVLVDLSVRSRLPLRIRTRELCFPLGQRRIIYMYLHYPASWDMGDTVKAEGSAPIR